MNRPVFFSWLLCILPLFLWAQEEGACLESYQLGEYDKAADCYSAFLLSEKTTDTTRLLQCYEHLGASLTMLDKKQPARVAFSRLLDYRKDYELDPNVYLPEVISLFQIAKFEKRTALRILIMDTLPAYPVAWNFLPLGGPQFFNRQPRKGVAVCALQAALLTLSIYSYQNKSSLYSDRFGYREEDVDRARQYDWAQRGTFFGFVTVYIYSLIDGFMNKRISLKE